MVCGLFCNGIAVLVTAGAARFARLARLAAVQSGQLERTHEMSVTRVPGHATTGTRMFGISPGSSERDVETRDVDQIQGPDYCITIGLHSLIDFGWQHVPSLLPGQIWAIPSRPSDLLSGPG